MLTLLLILTAAVTPAAPQAVELTAPDVFISIHPSSMDSYQLLKRKTPGTYTCTALVSQAGTNVAFASAELVVNPGTTEKITKQAGEYTLDFGVTIKSQRAEAVATVKRGDKVVTRQRSTVFLNAGEGNIPLR